MVNSGYDFIEHLMKNVSSKYFDIQPDDHRLGTFGYVNEGFGLLMDSAVINSITQANNLLLITADREHLLKGAFGSGENYNVFATPAKQDYLIGIPKDVIVTNENKNDAQIIYTLDDFSIDYDGLIYTLDNTIDVTASNNFDGTFNYSSKLNDASEVITPHLFTVKDVKDNAEFILIRVTMKQIVRTPERRSILENDLALKNMEFGFEDQICKISASYKIPNGEKQTLEVYNKYAIISSTEKYLKYFIDEEAKIIRIELDSFEPEYNSELTLNIYTTKGLIGNFKNTSPIVSVIDNDFLYALPVSDSAGGKDVIDTETLRTMIIQNTATLNSIDTVKDLQVKFDIDNDNNLISNKFYKKRDDYIKMEYASYAIFRDKLEKFPVPTNTLNAKLVVGVDEDLYHSTSKRRVYKPGTPLSLKSGQARLLEKNTTDTTDLQIQTAEMDNTKLMYGLPFLTIVSEAPDIVGYYLNSINKKIISEVEFDNTAIDYQFICNRINITRDAIASDDYSISANVIWNSNLPDGLLVDNALGDTSKLVGVIYIYDAENNVIAHKKMTLSSYNADNSYFTFDVTLKTDDYINEEDEIRMKDMCQPGVATVSDIMAIGSSAKIGLGIYVEDVNNSKGSYGSIVPNMDTYSISNVYAFNNVDFFLSLNYINSGITLTNEASTDYINLVDVPVVKYSYLKNNILDIADNVSILYNLLFEISKLINEDIDMKFFNTYGTSRYIKSDGVPVANVNTDLGIKITFADFVTDSYKENIKKTISDLIDVDGGFIVSNLFSELNSKYVLKSIELQAITGVSNVYKDIKLFELDFLTASSVEIREFVPEKFVINPDRITITSVVEQ